MTNICRFCARLEDLKEPVEFHDRVLFESPEFVVTPTVGSIVPGWLLVSPRAHYLSMGQVPENLWSELSEVVDRTATALSACFGPVSFFEHGPSCVGTTVGCGVDHAHLHVVASNDDFLGSTLKRLPSNFVMERVAEYRDVQRFALAKIPYLYCERSGLGSFVLTAPSIPSQFFRRALAGIVGCSADFDWRTSPFTHNILKTVHAVEKWKDQHATAAV
jgi:ATP adenylyltransferase